MQKVFSLWLLFCSVALSQDYALSIGVNNNGLTGAKKDAQNMKKFLGLKGVHVIALYNENANKERILQNINLLIKNLKKGDRFYLFFSGHGTNSFDPAIADDVKLQKLLQDTGALIPWDTQKGDYEDGLIVSKRDLVPLFKKLEAQKVETLVMVDACFSGGSYKSIGDNLIENIDLFYKTRSAKPIYPYHYITYISASTRSDYAIESREFNRGYFCVDLIECLKKEQTLSALRTCMHKGSLPYVILPQEGEKKLF